MKKNHKKIFYKKITPNIPHRDYFIFPLLSYGGTLKSAKSNEAKYMLDLEPTIFLINFFYLL